MRCKVGDLAMVTNAVNAGVIVRILRPSNFLGWWEVEAMSAAMRIRTPSPPQRVPAGTLCSAPDNELRPLRDDPGQDETLTWKSKEKQ